MIQTLAGMALESGVDLLTASRAPEPRTRATTPYEGASTARRLKNWLPSNQGINSMIFASGDMLRARSRDLVRKNAWAAGALDSFVANTVGTGIVPQPQHPDPKIRDLLSKEWLRWTDQADAHGMTDFYGLQAQACRSTMQDGEVFSRLRPRRAGDGLRIPLQLQLLESDFVPLAKNEPVPTGMIHGGIEFDRIGRRVAFHMYREHPGELQFSSLGNGGELVAVPARFVQHLFRPIRPGQFRGQPWFTPAIVTFYDIDQFVDATLARQKLSNLLSMFIKRGAGSDPVFNEEDQGDGTALATLESGETFYLEPGEEPVFSNPPDPGANYVDFLRSMLRGVARALGITYEQLSGDLENVNFSSIRAGLLEFRRWCETFQHQVLVYQFCRPVWGAWLDACAIAGIIPADDLTKNRPLYEDVEWQTAGWAYVNPIDDIETDKIEVRAGFNSRTAVVARRGRNAEQVDAEISIENQRADSFGLKYDSDGRNPDGGKAAASNGTGDEAKPKPGQPANKQEAQGVLFQ